MATIDADEVAALLSTWAGDMSTHDAVLLACWHFDKANGLCGGVPGNQRISPTRQRWLGNSFAVYEERLRADDPTAASARNQLIAELGVSQHRRRVDSVGARIYYEIVGNALCTEN